MPASRRHTTSDQRHFSDRVTRQTVQGRTRCKSSDRRPLPRAAFFVCVGWRRRVRGRRHHWFSAAHVTPGCLEQSGSRPLRGPTLACPRKAPVLLETIVGLQAHNAQALTSAPHYITAGNGEPDVVPDEINSIDAADLRWCRLLDEAMGHQVLSTPSLTPTVSSSMPHRGRPSRRPRHSAQFLSR